MNAKTDSQLADVLRDVLVSPNVADSNGEAANLVDVLDNHGRTLLDGSEKIAAGLHAIANAIGDLASAIREQNTSNG